MTKQPAETDLDAGKRSALESLFDSLPSELFPRCNMLQTISSAFRSQLAKDLEPVLNAHLQSTTAESLQDRRNIAVWLDHLLQDLGICAVVEGKPAFLTAELKDSHRPTSACYAILVPHGERFTRVEISSNVPHLTLEASPSGIEQILKSVRGIAYGSGRSL